MAEQRQAECVRQQPHDDVEHLPVLVHLLSDLLLGWLHVRDCHHIRTAGGRCGSG